MPTATVEIPVGATLSEEEARAIYSQGEDAVVFALLQLAKMLADQQAMQASSSHQTPATPSGMQPVYQKPNIAPRGKKRKKPGRKRGHQGSRRPPPERIDRLWCFANSDSSYFMIDRCR